jgi:predicted MPP superfamily phosphohydrolase
MGTLSMKRRAFLKGGGLALAGGLLGASALWDNERLVTGRVRVPLGAIRALRSFGGLRIAALGDLHLHPFTRLPFIRRAFQQARALRPDLIVLLGDFVDSTLEAMDELIPAMSDLDARLGVFAVLGNHDLRKGASVVEEGLRRGGVEVLRNRGLLLESGSSSIWLAGLDSFIGAQNLEAALQGCPSSVPKVLLAHEPDIADEVSADGRVCLQLSGHSHGGQVNVPGLVRRALPVMGRKYPFGSYSIGPLFLHTNRGIGMTQMPVRFRSAPEVSDVVVTSEPV